MPPRRAWPKASVPCEIPWMVSPSLRGGALADHDDGELAAPVVAAAQVVADLLDVEGPLGHEDRVGAAGQPAVGGDPAGVTAHHLDDDDAVVRLGRRVQAVDGVRGDLDRGLEAEGEVRPGQVVVDRLRHADARDALGRELARDAERVLAADGDQRVDAERVEGPAHALGARAVRLEGVGARGAEDRAAAVQDAAGAVGVQLEALALQHAGPPVGEPEEGVAVHVDALADDGTDDGVESGAVAAPGQKSDASHGAASYARTGLRRGPHHRAADGAGEAAGGVEAALKSLSVSSVSPQATSARTATTRAGEGSASANRPRRPGARLHPEGVGAPTMLPRRPTRGRSSVG